MSRSVRYSNLESGKALFYQLFKEPLLNVIGEFFMDDFNEELQKNWNCHSKLKKHVECTESPGFAFFLLCLYAFFMNVLVLSFLTAKLTVNFESTMKDASKYNAYLYFLITKKYTMKTFFVPPTSILLILFYFKRCKRHFYLYNPFLISNSYPEKINSIERIGRDQLICEKNSLGCC